jgi:hypothetical protein
MGFDTSEVDLLAADLAAAPAKVAVGTERALRGTARHLQRDAQRFAPVLTGALREGIVVDGHEVTSTVRYASYVEYGTSDTAPQPYMRPAADLAGPRLADGAGDAGEHIL